MGTLNLAPYKPVTNTTTDATAIAAAMTAIETLCNGNLDNTNIATAAAIVYSKLVLTGSIVNADIAAAAAIAISKLAGYPTDATKILRGDGTWQAAPRITVATIASPPGSPSDGDIWIATSVDGLGTRWQFSYNSGSASAYKWEFIGGPPMRISGDPNAVANTKSQVDSTGYYTDTSLMGIQVGRAGDYIISGASMGDLNGGVNGPLGFGVFATSTMGTSFLVPTNSAVSSLMTCPVHGTMLAVAASATVGIAMAPIAAAVNKLRTTSVQVIPIRVS